MELIKVTKNGKITSLELLKEINFFRNQESNFGKAEIKHNDLLKIIRSEFNEEIDEGKISLISYNDSMNRAKPMFELMISQAKQVLVRERKVVRKAVERIVKTVKGEILSQTTKLAGKGQIFFIEKLKVIT